ncbi:hypothetical protein ACLOJK_030349 [Asimina triloba]
MIVQCRNGVVGFARRRRDDENLIIGKARRLELGKGKLFGGFQAARMRFENSSPVGRKMGSQKVGRRIQKSDLIDELWRLESVPKMIRKVGREEGKLITGCWSLTGRKMGRWDEGDPRSQRGRDRR